VGATPFIDRVVYVGPEAQDLLAIDATTLPSVAPLADSFFAGSTASAAMEALRSRPDAILVSAETAKDYSIVPGDHIRVRVPDATGTLKTVEFTMAGIALEFPTAPRDSFFIANSAYLARTTGSAAVGTFLIQTPHGRPDQVAKLVAAQVGTGARVSDITTVRRDVSGSITSVELAGLTRVELGFALVLAAAATGLLLWLGLAERRRTFAIAQVLGATPRQLGSFIWSETVYVTLGGLLLGAAGATALALMLVKVLTGVFDPPPTTLAIPWLYLLGVAAVATTTVAIAGASAIRAVRRPAVSVLRDL